MVQDNTVENRTSNNNRIEHYFTEKPTSKKIIKKISFNNLEFFTSSGVFSFGKIDKGSEMLVKGVVLKDDWQVLDLGAGWGFVGISLKKKNPSLKVFMTEINERAVNLIRKNAKLNNAEVEVIQGTFFEQVKEKKFDTILLNPPQNAGRTVCYQMIEQSRDHLNEDGLLQVVARHKKGGEMLEKKMNETFGNVKTTIKESGFRVYVSKKE